MSPKVTALGFSLVVHALALGVLVFSFAQKPQPTAQRASRPAAVEAVVVDERRVQQELQRLKTDEQLRREAEEARKTRLQQEVELARKAKEQENQRLAELKQKREQEQREVEQQRKQDQREAEQQRKQLLELKAQQVQLEKDRAALEKKRAEEQERFVAAEKKRKSEEAKAQKAEADRRMREKIAAEEKRLAEERKGRLSTLARQYEDDIQDKIRRNWLRPTGTAERFECRVSVRQLPGGEVMSVQVTRSCGSPALDRSVEAAVRKASPLPKPPDPQLFDKDLNLTFKP